MNLSIITRKLSYKNVRSWYAGLVKRPSPEPPYSHITQIGDPVLRSVAESLSESAIQSSEIQLVIKSLKHVFKKYNCVGLSAPQIGVPLKICLVEFNEQHAKTYSKEERVNKEMSLVPFTIIINPELKIVDFKKIVYPEACESIKGFWADVPRYRAVEVKGLNEQGSLLSMQVKGWGARILQHEVDHLTGKLYTDIMHRQSLTCSCWEVVNERGGKIEIPYSPT